MENTNSFYSNEEEMTRDFGRKYEEEKKKIKNPVVLICGYTGSGKTTILRSILGKELVPDDRIGHGEPVTQKYDKYENEYIRIYDSKGLEPDKGDEHFISLTKKFIREKQENINVDNHIHVFWYVIQGSGARVTDTDLKIIKTFPKESTIVIISKKNITKEIELKTMRERLRNSGVSNDRIIAVDESSKDMKELMTLTDQIMPEAYIGTWAEAYVAWIEAQKRKLDEIEDKKVKAVAIITGAATVAGAAGAIPIPGSDAPIITGVQMGMIAGLAALYEVGIQKEQFLPMLTAIAERQAATSLLKFIPVAGSVISAGVAVTLTGGIGWFVQNQFERIAIATVKGEKRPSLSFDIKAALAFIKNNKKRLT